MWLRRLIHNLDQQLSTQRPVLYVDSHAAIKLTKNPEFHKRSKHIDTRYHYIREKYEEKKFDLKPISTDNQLAN